MCQHSALRDVATSQPFALTWTTPPPAPAAATAALAGIAAAPFENREGSRDFASTASRCFSAPFWSSPQERGTTTASGYCRDLTPPARRGLLPSPPLAGRVVEPSPPPSPYPHDAAAAAACAAAQMSNDSPSWNPNVITYGATPASGSGRMAAPSRQDCTTGGHSILGKRGGPEYARFSDRELFFAGISELHARQEGTSIDPEQTIPFARRLPKLAAAAADFGATFALAAAKSPSPAGGSFATSTSAENALQPRSAGAVMPLGTTTTTTTTEEHVTRGLLLEARYRRRMVEAARETDLEPPAITAMHRSAASNLVVQRFSQHFAQHFAEQFAQQQIAQQCAEQQSASDEGNRLLRSCSDDRRVGNRLADEGPQQQLQRQQQQQLWRHHRLHVLAESQAGKGMLAVPPPRELDHLGEADLQRSTLGMAASLPDGHRHRVQGEEPRSGTDSGCASWLEAGARQSTIGGARLEENGSEKLTPLEKVMLQSGFQSEQQRKAERQREVEQRQEAEHRVMDRNGTRRKRLCREEEKLSALLLASHQAVMQQQREQLELQRRQKLVMEQSRELVSLASQREPCAVAAQIVAEGFTCAAGNGPVFFGPGKDPGAYVNAASYSGTTTGSFGRMSPPSRPLLDLNLSLSLSSLSSEEIPDSTAC